MPKLLGMEPETVSKAKPLLLIGGGALLLYFILKGRGNAVPVSAPSDGTPTMAVSAPSAQGELSQSGTVVDALQKQMQQHQMDYDVAASNLALQQQSQQMRFEEQAQEYSLQRQKALDAQSDAITHEQFKQLKKQGKHPWYQTVLDIVGQGAQIYGETQGIPVQRKPVTKIAKPYRSEY